MDYTVGKLLDTMNDKNHVVFQHDDRPFNLNLIGIRNKDRISNKFNDTMCIMYKHLGRWSLLQYAITTDPGLIYRLKPINDNGTAIVAPGQYPGVWALGDHKGHPALVQVKPISVIRDNNKDNVLDTNLNAIDTGMFGINCHKSGKGITDDVDYYSAGCIVHADNVRFEKEFLPILNAAVDVYGNSFTFTLLNDSDF